MAAESVLIDGIADIVKDVYVIIELIVMVK